MRLYCITQYCITVSYYCLFIHFVLNLNSTVDLWSDFLKYFKTVYFGFRSNVIFSKDVIIGFTAREETPDT